MPTRAVSLIENDDGSITVEGETPQAALDAVHSRLGPEAEIVKASKVSRGGIGGFFAREEFHVTARGGDAVSRGGPRPQVGGAEPDPIPEPGRGLEAVLRAAEQRVDDSEETFGDLLRRELAEGRLGGGQGGSIDLREGAGAPLPAAPTPPEPTATLPEPETPPEATATSVEAERPTPPTPAPAGPRPVAPEPVRRPPAPSRAGRDDLDLGAVVGPCPTGAGAVRWSVDALSHMGLPYPLVASVADLDPDDDLGWITTLAGAVRPLCGALPETELLTVGPLARRMGGLLDQPVVTFPDLPPFSGSACLESGDDGANRAWLTRVQGNRPLHLLMGGRGWVDLLAKPTAAVSFVGADLLVTALQIAVEREVPVAFGDIHGRLTRCTPLDLALGLRELMDRA